MGNEPTMEAVRNVPIMSWNANGKPTVNGHRSVSKMGTSMSRPRPLSSLSANQNFQRPDSQASRKEYVVNFKPKKATAPKQAPKIVGYAGHIPSIRDTCAESFRDSLTTANKEYTSMQRSFRRPVSAPAFDRSASAMSFNGSSLFSSGLRSGKTSSNLILGDNRLWVPKSTNSVVYGRSKDDEEEQLMSPEKRSQQNQRRRVYEAAKRRVTAKRINEIKNQMHAKIDQSITGGPFQLRRSFRMFDRSASGLIDLENFTSTLREFFSMAVTEEEVTALFAVYDRDLNGGIDYKEFATIIMEPDFVQVNQW